MGGSGGGSPQTTRERVRFLVDQASQNADDSAYQSEVNSILDDALSEFNDRDVEEVHRHLGAIKTTLEEMGEGAIDLRYGGSVRKHTYVDGLSDVDVLAILNGSELGNMSAQETIETFAARLRQHLPGTQVTAGKLAVTIRYSDGTELQVLPALKTATGIRIARSVGEGWSNVVRPDAFAKKLTAQNAAHGGKLVPTIKLFKALVGANSPAGIKLSGYHAESLSIEAFENYSGRLTPKAMLHHFCHSAAMMVHAPIQDGTGQSLHVDDYLGSAGSQQRRALSAQLNRLARRIEMADHVRDPEVWRNLFEAD